jgi:tripartite-type tricarboxylate transporter receptor subunit TctC
MKRLIAAFFAVFAIGASASAQEYPTRSITIVAPFPAGASVDIIARSMGEYLTSKLGQTIIIENRPGAAGNIGAANVVRAAPDGYTLLMATTGQVSTNKFMYSDLTFDSERDLEPIAVVGTAALLVTARPDAPFDSLKGLVEYAKANPDKINAGYPGNGTLGHITGELISQSQKVKFTAVQFQGSAQIIPALLGSQIDIAIDTLPPYVPVIQSNRIKGLAIGSKVRNPNLPNVPTMVEAGFPGLEASVFYALLAPKGTPPAIITKLNAAANEFLKSEAATKVFEKVGIVANISTPAEAKTYIKSENEKWGPIIKGANIKF